MLVSGYGGWDVGDGESGSMKSSGPFVDRVLKRGDFIVGMRTVEHCPCSASTDEAFVHHFIFHWSFHAISFTPYFHAATDPPPPSSQRR